jgi:3-hydroxybutyryl-CoA dehydrogenase
LAAIRGNLDRQASKGSVTEDQKEQALARISPAIEIEAAADADIVIEAAPERMEVKKEIFRRLDSGVKSSAILATNTSSLSIAEIAAATARPRLTLRTGSPTA